MMTPSAALFRARLLAGFGTAALVAAGCLASSRPARTAGGPTTVTVGNVPLPTISSQEPALQPFQIHLQPSSMTGAVAATHFVVPAGKRLVLETVSSAYGSAQVTGHGGFVELITTAGGAAVPHYLADTNFAQNRQNLSVRLYADPGSAVTAQAVGYAAGGVPPTTSAADLELSGYYVSVP